MEVIQIVDDNLQNRELLRDLVVDLGYTPLLAASGAEALSQLEERDVDLVLLDILMPEMSGFEVLKRIKRELQLTELPVIIISALAEQESVLRGIEGGAVDYLPKPFNQHLLEARIRSALAQVRLARQERNYRINLQREVSTKTQQLQDANLSLQRLEQAKSDFLRLISHELRTPLNSLGPAIDSLIEGHLDPDGRQQMQQLIKCATEQLEELVEQASLLSKIQIEANRQQTLDSLSLVSLLATSLQNLSRSAKRRGVHLHMPEQCNQQVMGEELLLSHGLRALIRSAMLLAKHESDVHIQCDCDHEYARILINVTTWPLNQGALSEFFSLYNSHHINTGGGNLGLSPALASRIIEFFDGTVAVANNSDQSGVTLTVYLPSPDKGDVACPLRQGRGLDSGLSH